MEIINTNYEDTPQINEKVIKTKFFEAKLQQIKPNSQSSLVIIADYDDTFTKAFINGRKSRTSFNVVDCSSFISGAYLKEAQVLREKYKGSETDVSINLETRNNLMHEWYNKSLFLMSQETLSTSSYERLVTESFEEKHLLFRNGLDSFFNTILLHRIPLIIISAGIKEVIQEELRVFLKLYDTLIKEDLLHIIANEFIYEEDKVKDYKKPAIYTYNKSTFLKNEIMSLPLPLIKHKEKLNIIFFGDHMNDIDSLKEVKYKNVLSIAFFNKNDETDAIPKDYHEKYDAIITRDGDFAFINEILQLVLVN